MRRAAVAPVLVMSAVLVGACASTSSNGKKSTTKPSFVAQADDICRTYEERAGKATQKLKHPDPDKRIALVQGRLLPLMERRDEQLALLKPPAADRAAAAQFIADLKAATDAIALNPRAYVAEHGTSALAQKTAAEAAALGFAVCGRT